MSLIEFYYTGYIAGMLMIMSMLKQASSKAWLSSNLWLLEFEINSEGKVA